MSHVIDAIRNARLKNKVSQGEIAKLLNMSTSNYSEIEQKRVNLKVEDFLILCRHLNLPISHFNNSDSEINLTINKNDIKVFQNIINIFNKQIDMQNDIKIEKIISGNNFEIGSIDGNENLVFGDNNNINFNNKDKKKDK